MKLKRIVSVAAFRVLLLALPLVIGIGGPCQASGSKAHSGFFDLYQANRDQGIPNYITEDFLLLSYGMIRKETMGRLEEQVLMPDLKGLIAGLRHHLNQGKGPAIEANLDFVAILEALLEGKETPHKPAKGRRAQAELALVLSAKGIVKSPLWEWELDYSRFAPRGPYTRSEARKRYFRAMGYASAVLFAVKESKATGITREMADRMAAQALALARAISGDKKLSTIYARLNNRLAWSFGPTDDLVLKDLVAVAESQEKAKKKADMTAFRKALFQYAVKNDRRPRILGAMVRKDALEKGLTPRDVLTGWRLLPQRYSPDSAALQALVYDSVTDYQGRSKPFGLAVIQGRPVKGFPRALELMALLGSKKAVKALKAGDDMNFKGYHAAFSKARSELGMAKGLSALHLGLISHWLSAGRKGIPGENRRLNTALSFWTWQRYVGALYFKQSVTVAGKGLALPKKREGAWLEPAVELYLALAHTVAKHRQVTPDPTWDKFAALLDLCIEISFKEIQGIANKGEDDRFLNDLDLTLKKLIGGGDHPIIVDIHTEPTSKQVVEEAIGWPKVVLKAVSKGKSARGALITHHEFKHPMADRLTDEKWQKMLKEKGEM